MKGHNLVIKKFTSLITNKLIHLYPQYLWDVSIGTFNCPIHRTCPPGAHCLVGGQDTNTPQPRQVLRMCGEGPAGWKSWRRGLSQGPGRKARKVRPAGGTEGAKAWRREQGRGGSDDRHGGTTKSLGPQRIPRLGAEASRESLLKMHESQPSLTDSEPAFNRAPGRFVCTFELEKRWFRVRLQVRKCKVDALRVGKDQATKGLERHAGGDGASDRHR